MSTIKGKLAKRASAGAKRGKKTAVEDKKKKDEPKKPKQKVQPLQTLLHAPLMSLEPLAMWRFSVTFSTQNHRIAPQMLSQADLFRAQMISIRWTPLRAHAGTQALLTHVTVRMHILEEVLCRIGGFCPGGAQVGG